MHIRLVNNWKINSIFCFSSNWITYCIFYWTNDWMQLRLLFSEIPFNYCVFILRNSAHYSIRWWVLVIHAARTVNWATSSSIVYTVEHESEVRYHLAASSTFLQYYKTNFFLFDQCKTMQKNYWICSCQQLVFILQLSIIFI